MYRKWIRVLTVVVTIMIVANACSSNSSTETVVTNATVEVVYQVLSQEMASTEVTYTFNGGNDIVREMVDLPWQKTFQMHVGDIVDVGAKTDGSTATCRILVDGIKYRENTQTDGNFPVCQGMVEPAE